MDLNINEKNYKFMLFHTHIAEDICANRAVCLKFKRINNECYLSEPLKFNVPSASESELVNHLIAPFVYYVKNTNNIMINYVERDVPEGIEVSNLGMYIFNDNDDGLDEVCEYFKTSPEEIVFELV